MSLSPRILLSDDAHRTMSLAAGRENIDYTELVEIAIKAMFAPDGRRRSKAGAPGMTRLSAPTEDHRSPVRSDAEEREVDRLLKLVNEA